MLLRCAPLLFWLVIVGALTSSMSLLGSRAAWREVFTAGEEFENNEHESPTSSVFALDTSADGTTVLCCLRGDEAKKCGLYVGTHDGSMRRLVATELPPIPNLFWQAVLFPDGKSLLIAGPGIGVSRMELQTGVVSRMRSGDSAATATRLAIAPCGGLFSIAHGPEVVVCETTDGQVRMRLPSPSVSVTDIAFSSDGTLIATARGNGDIQLWNSDTGDLKHVLTGHIGPATCVRFADSGARLATAGMDGTIRLWDTETPELMWTDPGDGNGLRGLAVSPDGATAAAGGFGGTIRVYDLVGRCEREPLEGHAKAVTALRFASNGALLVSAGDDGTIRYWDAAAHFAPVRCINVNASLR